MSLLSEVSNGFPALIEGWGREANIYHYNSHFGNLLLNIVDIRAFGDYSSLVARQWQKLDLQREWQLKGQRDWCRVCVREGYTANRFHGGSPMAISDSIGDNHKENCWHRWSLNQQCLNLETCWVSEFSYHRVAATGKPWNTNILYLENTGGDTTCPQWQSVIIANGESLLQNEEALIRASVYSVYRSIAIDTETIIEKVSWRWPFHGQFS